MQEVAVEKALTFIEPGPVVLVTTAEGAKQNVMTISWTMAIDFAQHIVLTAGGWNYSFDALMRTKECCVCIPPASMAKTVVGIGMVSGADTDKFEKFHLHPLPAQQVAAPLLEECIACLECKEVEDRRLLHAVGDGIFFADGEKFNLRQDMLEKLPPRL